MEEREHQNTPPLNFSTRVQTHQRASIHHHQAPRAARAIEEQLRKKERPCHRTGGGIDSPTVHLARIINSEWYAVHAPTAEYADRIPWLLEGRTT